MAKKDTTTYVVIGGVVLVIAYIYYKGHKSTSTTATSVANSPNSPVFPVTSMGSQVTQLIPTNQVTPNEPGTAPILNVSGGYQYG